MGLTAMAWQVYLKVLFAQTSGFSVALVALEHREF
jgi:hypothetical protein